MKSTIKSYFILSLTLCLINTGALNAQIKLQPKELSKENMVIPVSVKDEQDVKEMVEHFLMIAGNYDIDAMSKLMTTNANIGISRYKEGNWNTETKTVQEFINSVKDKAKKPYYETISQFNITLSEGRLAFVKADAIIYSYGLPVTQVADFFTLIKENDNWKFLSLSFTSKPIAAEKAVYDAKMFAKGYAQAWGSQKPDFVASFFTESGTLKVNNGDPAKGYSAISKVAEGFMTACPNMTVTMDSLSTTAKGTTFKWTLKGTNTGPKGTGKQVQISGFEQWKLSDTGLIMESTGSYDKLEYERQLKNGFGTTNK